jgi:hypothetical protein
VGAFFLGGMVKVTTILKGGIEMENTHEYVKKLQENQKKQEKNKKHQGYDDPEKKLPNKQH